MQFTTNAFASYKKDTAMRRSEALRQSMLAVMESSAFGHLAFWAPYALVGEGGIGFFSCAVLLNTHVRLRGQEIGEFQRIRMPKKFIGILDT
jgi:hypothetical protein